MQMTGMQEKDCGDTRLAQHIFKKYFREMNRKAINDDGKDALLSDSLDQLHQIFETAATGMRVIDTNYNLVQMNKSFCKLSGAVASEALAKKCYEVFPGNLCHTSECPFAQIVRGENRIECFVEKKHKRGYSVQCLMTATPLHDNRGRLTGIVEHFIDINHPNLASYVQKQNGTAPADNGPFAEDLKTTLKVLFDENSQFRRETEDSVLLNIKKLIPPCIVQLKKTRLTTEQKNIINTLESHLDNITSRFVKRLSSKLINLTPTEIDVANLVKDGKTNDEIAAAMYLAKNTILTHRYHIRSKLKLKSKKINLQTYLQTLEE